MAEEERTIMADDQQREKADIAELARNAADAVAKLAVEVGHLVMEGVRSAWESARRDEATTPADTDGSEIRAPYDRPLIPTGVDEPLGLQVEDDSLCSLVGAQVSRVDHDLGIFRFLVGVGDSGEL